MVLLGGEGEGGREWRGEEGRGGSKLRRDRGRKSALINIHLLHFLTVLLDFNQARGVTV